MHIYKPVRFVLLCCQISRNSKGKQIAQAPGTAVACKWICSWMNGACLGLAGGAAGRSLVRQLQSWPGLWLGQDGSVVGLPQMFLCFPDDCK